MHLLSNSFENQPQTMMHWWEKEIATIVISGCMQSDKTYFTKRLLAQANGMFMTPPSKIVYAYSKYQSMFDDKKDIIFHQDLPIKEDIESCSHGSEHTVLVLDDFMLKIVQSKDYVQLFTVMSHHRNITCIFLTQNLYLPGRYT